MLLLLSNLVIFDQLIGSFDTCILVLVFLATTKEQAVTSHLARLGPHIGLVPLASSARQPYLKHYYTSMYIIILECILVYTSS